LWQVCTNPVARKTHKNAYSLPLCRSQFGHSTFSVASLVFMKGTSFCGIATISSRVEPLTSWCAKFYRPAWFPLLFACQLVEFDTPVIFHVFTYCLGSFLFKDMLLSLHKFAFEGQKYEFYREHVANLHYIVRRARLWLELFASTLGRSLSDIIFHIPEGNDSFPTSQITVTSQNTICVGFS